MGELIIRIDQATGAVLQVEQKLNSNDKEVLSKKIGKEPLFNMLRMADQKDYQRVERLSEKLEKLREIEKVILHWCRSDERELVIPLVVLGNLYHSDPKVVRKLLEHRDTFKRFIPLPIELWERPGNTVCTMNCAGVIIECCH